jgi:hypothetical protein
MCARRWTSPGTSLGFVWPSNGWRVSSANSVSLVVMEILFSTKSQRPAPPVAPAYQTTTPEHRGHRADAAVPLSSGVVISASPKLMRPGLGMPVCPLPATAASAARAMIGTAEVDLVYSQPRHSPDAPSAQQSATVRRSSSPPLAAPPRQRADRFRRQLVLWSDTVDKVFVGEPAGLALPTPRARRLLSPGSKNTTHPRPAGAPRSAIAADW